MRNIDSEFCNRDATSLMRGCLQRPFGYTSGTVASGVLHLYAGKRRLPSGAQIGPLEFDPPMLTEGLGAGTNRGLCVRSSTRVLGCMARNFSGILSNFKFRY